MSPPEDGKGRLPGQGSGPRINPVTTAAMVTAPRRGVFDVSDLPAGIAARIAVDPQTGCWIAGPPHDRYGYARYHSGGLHREVYQLLAGDIPPGLVLDHVQSRGCRSHACCFPGHLEPVTNRVNVLRGDSFAAVNYRKDRCDHGHPFDLLNTYWRPGGHRDCRACIRDRVRRYQRRRRQVDATGLRRAA